MATGRPGQENTAETTANRLSARAELRRRKIAERTSLPAATHAQRSAQLAAHLELLLQRCPVTIIGFCWPIRAEFDCRPLIIAQVARGARACLPLVTAAAAAMSFRQWLPHSPMAIDRHGIHYPADGDTLVPELLLMPVNAFDAQGYRLGYGGGYFDRTLATLKPPPLTVGLGFELARVDSTLPGEHDIPMDAVVTEAGLEIYSPRLSPEKTTGRP